MKPESGNPFTVVAYYEDTQQAWCEEVWSVSAEQAYDSIQNEIDEEDRCAVIVGVFEGHLADRLVLGPTREIC